ncbi:secretion/DNA translocation related TadE-like protein [Prauserella sediminis]|uniref:Secretion/DNA translocation related TadE-like protein n=1 Tax=Prauserella sediminis TaxID=577680 RepID=A0A839XRM9_9PSEU|nr:Rv3654c family TadE-like protein [Prauserella sediminis]MBB3663283.1 secretion/DNA translocation related TadE-like protein [Prauserella sediminis]
MRFVGHYLRSGRDPSGDTASADFGEATPPSAARPWNRAASQREVRARNADEGMATVWGAFAIAGLLAVAGVVWLVGHVAVVRQQVANAADLAALAAAGKVDRSVGEACRLARTVADRMHVDLADCRVAHPDALVTVEAGGGPWLAAFGPVAARARAGPAATEARPDDEQRSTARGERYPRPVEEKDSAQESPIGRAPPSGVRWVESQATATTNGMSTGDGTR